MSDEREYLPKENEEPELESEDVEAHQLGGPSGYLPKNNDEGEDDDVEAHQLGGPSGQLYGGNG